MEMIIKEYSSLIGQLDRATYMHSKNVAHISAFLAEKAGLEVDVAYKARYNKNRVQRKE